jgi:hypothetical protein
LNFVNSSLLWDVFIINSVEQLQTLPKTQSEIDTSPFLKTQKPSSTLIIDISPFLKTQKPSSTLIIDISPFLKTQNPPLLYYIRVEEGFCVFRNGLISISD